MKTDEPEAAVLVYTIGHGNRTSEEFTGLLHAFQIGCLVDVRAFPGSRRHPQFGRAELERSLEAASVEYAWEGVALGGRRRSHAESRHVALRNASFRAYADHMETRGFREGVDRVLGRAADMPVAIMCAERLPWQCHRYMISDYLVAHGVEVLHLIDASAPKRHRLRAEARVREGDIIYDGTTQSGLGLD